MNFYQYTPETNGIIPDYETQKIEEYLFKIIEENNFTEIQTDTKSDTDSIIDVSEDDIDM